MKENLEVKQFSLKEIVQNLNSIPKDGGAKFGDETPKLSPQQKKDLMEKVGNYNELGKVLRCETAIMELAKSLNEIGQMAESYAMTEASDYFEAETMKRDFNEVKKITKEFSKRARECHGGLMQLNALYEDVGAKLQRYFEIKSLDEIANALNVQGNSAAAPQVGEVAQEEEGVLEEDKKSISRFLIERAFRSINETGQRTIRGSTPRNPQELKQTLLRLPPNSSITFYDDRTLYSSTGTQQRKLPPFKTITKEIHNAIGKSVYIHTDNRGQPVITREEEIDSLVKDIFGLSILNKFVIQYDVKKITSTPAPISRPTPTGKILPMDKLSKIRAATPDKYTK